MGRSPGCGHWLLANDFASAVHLVVPENFFIYPDLLKICQCQFLYTPILTYLLRHIPLLPRIHTLIIRTCSILFAVAGVVGFILPLARCSLPEKTDPFVTGLGPQLSGGASIVLPEESALFANLTARYSNSFGPGITPVVSVGTEADISRVVGPITR